MQHPNFALCFVYRRIGFRNYQQEAKASSTSITSTFTKLWLSTSSPLGEQKVEEDNTKHENIIGEISEGGQTSRKKKKRILHRREFVGLAKAVDRGQFETVYQPMAKNGTFMALSGLPDRTKLFSVLGIESSCDDTGGMYVLGSGITHLIHIFLMVLDLSSFIFFCITSLLSAAVRFFNCRHVS